MVIKIMLQESRSAVTQSVQAPQFQAPVPARKTQDTAVKGLANEVARTMHAFQDAIDKATLACLIVEPSFQAVGNRFVNVGVSSEGYFARCNIYRKLS